MKVDNKNVLSDPPVTHEINFIDKDINKLRVKEGDRINIKFKNTNVSYLNGVILRYLPLTQKKERKEKKKKTQKMKKLLWIVVLGLKHYLLHWKGYARTPSENSV